MSIYSSSPIFYKLKENAVLASSTGILCLFLGPLAWGIAIVVAFKYGVKDAIVAYARERK
ncbi:MAG: hypothetical protein AB9861_16770 [Methanosarcina sp.]